MNLPESKLTKNQKLSFVRKYKGVEYHLEIRHDDECGNGHNTFAMTYHVWNRRHTDYLECGSNNELIAEVWPEYAHLLKWHLTSTDGPMHYIANTLYWVEQGNLEYARSTAVWPEAKIEQLLLGEKVLLERLPELMQAFKADVESIGLEY